MKTESDPRSTANVGGNKIVGGNCHSWELLPTNCHPKGNKSFWILYLHCYKSCLTGKIFFNCNEISFWKVRFCESGLTLYYTPSKHLTELDLLHSPVIKHCLTREWRQEWSVWEDYSSLQCNNLQCSRQTEVLSRGPCCSNHPEASASDQPPFPAFHLLINLPLLQPM